MNFIIDGIVFQVPEYNQYLSEHCELFVSCKDHEILRVRTTLEKYIDSDEYNLVMLDKHSHSLGLNRITVSKEIFTVLKLASEHCTTLAA